MRAAWPLAGALFLLVGCGIGSSESERGFLASSANRFFTIGYEDLTDIYIERVDLDKVALAGLQNLDTVEPELAVGSDGRFVHVTLRGSGLGDYPLPGASDTTGWASLTADVIEAGRIGSPQLKKATSETIYEAIFDGIVEELDEYSRYAGAEEAQENRASRDGFGGIGIRIDIVDEGVKVVSVMDATPAMDSGLQAGDVIIAIDGIPAAGIEQREAVRRLRGPLRSSVYLMVLRESVPEPLPIQVTRAHIVPQTVTYERRGRVAYLKVSGFNHDTARVLRERVFETRQYGRDSLDGIILDLRGNPGGLLDQAVAVSDLFITGGTIVSTRGRHPNSHQLFDAESDDEAEGLPLAVLVDGGSASASEIVAAALQDSGRAVVIGSSSFGKGTVQTVLRLPNEGELTLTWARFHAPSGYALNGRGVMPDICTSGQGSTSETVISSLKTGALPIAPDVRRRQIDDRDEQAVIALRAHCPQTETVGDIDIQVATALLSDRSLYARALGGTPRDTANVGPEQVLAN